MTNVLNSVGHAIGNIFKKKDTNRTIDKNIILNLIDNALTLLNSVSLGVSNTIALSEYIRQNKNSIKHNDFQKAYSEYLSTVGKSETNNMFGNIHNAIQFFVRDLEAIRDNFDDLFSNGTNTTDIDIEQIRTTHAAIIGYITNIEMVATWYCYMVSLIETPEESDKAPGYRIKYIVDHAKHVGETIRYIATRLYHKTILDDIKNIKEGGHDVFLITNGNTIDTYAHDSDFERPVHGFFNGWSILTPFLMTTDAVMQYSRWRYERNKAMREWLLTKTAMIQLTMNKKDPNDPEYERLNKILISYSNLVTDYDRKIANYENNV